MPRVKRGVTARARHKKIIALAKGYRLRRNNVFRVAKQAVISTPTAIAVTRSTCSVAYGLRVLTPQRVLTV